MPPSSRSVPRDAPRSGNRYTDHGGEGSRRAWRTAGGGFTKAWRGTGRRSHAASRLEGSSSPAQAKYGWSSTAIVQQFARPLSFIARDQRLALYRRAASSRLIPAAAKRPARTSTRTNSASASAPRQHQPSGPPACTGVFFNTSLAGDSHPISRSAPPWLTQLGPVHATGRASKMRARWMKARKIASSLS